MWISTANKTLKIKRAVLCVLSKYSNVATSNSLYRLEYSKVADFCERCCVLIWVIQLNFMLFFSKDHHHIFVGDLAEDIDDTTLRKAFQPFGDIS